MSRVTRKPARTAASRKAPRRATPARKAPARKTAARKATTRALAAAKASARKTAPVKSARKAIARKPAARKATPTARKASAKAAPRKAAARKPAARKSAPRKVAATKSARRATARRPARRAAARKSTRGKSSGRKSSRHRRSSAGARKRATAPPANARDRSGNRSGTTSRTRALRVNVGMAEPSLDTTWRRGSSKSVAGAPAPDGIGVGVVRLAHASGLPLPTYQSVGAAGLDLVAALPPRTTVTLRARARALLPTGLVLELPAGFEAQVRPRSGLAMRDGLTVLNTPGTIDSDYRGEVQVLLVNLGSRPVRISRGDRIAQLVVAPVSRATLIERSEVSQTARGEGGFGSTGRSIAEAATGARSARRGR